MTVSARTKRARGCCSALGGEGGRKGAPPFALTLVRPSHIVCPAALPPCPPPSSCGGGGGGADPATLAASFARTYGLDSAMETKLCALIERYLVEVVPDLASSSVAHSK